jgi:hypothetical protein
MTGERLGYLPQLESPADRKVAVDAWKKWLAEKSANAPLNLPLKFTHRVLVTDYQRGRILEFDAEGNQTGTSDYVPGAFACQGLDSGNYLIARHQHRKVVELDQSGTLVWESESLLPVYPTAVERLEGGHTLVAGSDLSQRGGMVLELDRQGRVVPNLTVELASPPSDARRLPNGNTLVTFTDERGEGKVVELTRTGLVVESGSLGGLANPVTARRLPNGNTLVVELANPSRRRIDRPGGVATLEGQGHVTEYGPKKEIVWTKRDDLFNVLDAERLDNGHTLILDGRGLRQVDENGKEAWSKQIPGARRLCVFHP